MTTTFVADVTATGSTNTGSEENPFNTIDLVLSHDGDDTVIEWRDQVVPWPTVKNLAHGGGGVGRECVWRSRNPLGCKFEWIDGNSRNAFLHVNSGVDYRVFEGFEIDGNGGQSNLFIQTSAGANRHHYTVQDCFLHHLGGAGSEFASMDYVRFLRNMVWIAGKRPDGTSTTGSGVSLNAKGSPYVYDTRPCFHSVIAGNIFAGCSGAPSDGNGWILDNGGPSAGTASVGSILVARNLSYMNGNRGGQNLNCKPITGGKIAIVQNMAWKNGLDQTTNTAINGFLSEFEQSNGVADWLGNYSRAMDTVAGTKFGTTPFRDAAPGSSVIRSYDNFYTGGKTSAFWAEANIDDGALPTSITDVEAALAGTLPTIDTGASEAYLDAPDPRTLGTIFRLLEASALRDACRDPFTLPGLTDEMRADMAPFVRRDLANVRAPQ